MAPIISIYLKFVMSGCGVHQEAWTDLACRAHLEAELPITYLRSENEDHLIIGGAVLRASKLSKS